MTLIFDLMHIVAAALLAIVGLSYEREEECTPPVQQRPAAHVIQYEIATAPAVSEVRWTADCEAASGSVFYPVL